MYVVEISFSHKFEGCSLEADPTPEELNRFLSRVMEIEEKYAFTRKGQDSARKAELRALVDDLIDE